MSKSPHAEFCLQESAGCAGHVIVTGKKLHIIDVQTDRRYDPTLDHYTGYV